jgi:hypothetical protein
MTHKLKSNRKKDPYKSFYNNSYTFNNNGYTEKKNVQSSNLKYFQIMTELINNQESTNFKNKTNHLFVKENIKPSKNNTANSVYTNQIYKMFNDNKFKERTLKQNITQSPFITLLSENDDSIVFSWGIITNDCIPIYSFNLYINNIIYLNVKNTIDKPYLQMINKNFIKNLFYNHDGNYNFTLHVTTVTENKRPPYTYNTCESLPSNYIHFTVIEKVQNNCDCAFYNSLFKNDTIIQINNLLTNYNTNIYSNNELYIDLDTYNNYNVCLKKIQQKIDSNCCFCNIINIYEDILKIIWASYNKRNDYFNLVEESKKWKEDSKILNDKELLQEFIKNMETTPLISITVNSINCMIKPQYLRYFELYGIPNNLEFDPIKLMEIDLELSSVDSC